ncbi:restriction endonuclease subunit S [Nostoc sp.]|uniref:restriction endonuclease subunit S n=1 Tax=Nostoc sp. TaxID=1180 RepID=UPI002FFB65EF
MNIPQGYKQTKIGLLSEDWEIHFLGEKTTKIGSGITPTGGAKVYKKEGRPFVRSQNVGWGQISLEDIAYIDDVTHDTFKNTEIMEGDVFLNITGASIGRSAVADKRVVNGNVNQHVCIIRPIEEELNSYFLNCFLLSNKGQKQIDAFQAGGNRQGLNFGQIKSFEIPLPPTLEEQKTIAQSLSDVDALITECDRLITKKRNTKQSTMQQLLTGKKGLPGFSGEWEVKTLGNYITDFKGGAPLAPSDFTKNGVKVLPKGAVSKGGILTIEKDKLQYCSVKYADIHKSNLVDNTYTIVVLRDLVPSGPAIGLIVKIKTNDIFILAQGVYGFKVKDEDIDIDFIIQLSNSWEYRNLMKNIMVGSTQVHITNTEFLKLQIYLPPLPEQKAIAQVLSDMDAEIAAIEQKRDKYKTIKQGMMQELLTGKTRLKVEGEENDPD